MAVSSFNAVTVLHIRNHSLKQAYLFLAEMCRNKEDFMSKEGKMMGKTNTDLTN